MQVGGVADSELQRAVDVARQACTQADRCDLHGAHQAPGLRVVDGEDVRRAAPDDLHRVLRRPAAFVHDHRHVHRAGELRHCVDALHRLLDTADTRLGVHCAHRLDGRLQVAVAAIHVGEDVHVVADRPAHRLHDGEVFLRIAGHLDLQPDDAVGDDLGRFLRRYLRGCHADAVTQRNPVAHRAAEELVDRHSGAAGDDVEHRCLDHRLGVGESAHLEIHARKVPPELARVGTDEHRGEALAHEVGHDVRVLAEVTSVLAAPAQERRRFAEPRDSLVGRHLQDYVAPDWRLQRAPGVRRSAGKLDDDRLHRGDFHFLYFPSSVRVRVRSRSLDSRLLGIDAFFVVAEIPAQAEIQLCRSGRPEAQPDVQLPRMGRRSMSDYAALIRPTHSGSGNNYMIISSL